MNEIGLRRRATVHDVARAAGVSLATVDRVLNGRPGVRAATAEKVEAAIAEIGFQRDLSRLAAGAGPRSQAHLHHSRWLQRIHGEPRRCGGAPRRAGPDRPHAYRDACASGRSMPMRWRKASTRSIARHCDCAIIVASEEPSVLAAVDSASRRGIVVMTLVSDLPGIAAPPFHRHRQCRRRPHRGVAAGALPAAGRQGGGHRRLAASARPFRPAGGLPRSAGGRVSPLSTLIGPIEGHDERRETEAIVADLLARHPDLAGLYNLGAGNAGLVAALEASRPVRRHPRHCPRTDRADPARAANRAPSTWCSTRIRMAKSARPSPPRAPWLWAAMAAAPPTPLKSGFSCATICAKKRANHQTGVARKMGSGGRSDDLHSLS